LDAIAPDRPVIIWQRSFHEVILNTAALKSWGFPDAEALEKARLQFKADKAHVDFERGHFSETGLPIALSKMQPVILSPQRISTGMAGLRQMMQSKGVTTASDMATGIFSSFDAEARMIVAGIEQAAAPSRMMLLPTAAQLDQMADPLAWYEATRARYASSRIRMDKRVKLLADGAFFAQNMRMNQPGYLDGHVGKWITEPAVLTKQAGRYWELGFHLHIHVNGDEGLDVVLDALSPLPRDGTQTITLEHLGYSTEAQNRRIAKMDLMVSAQPNYIRVLGEAYAAHGLGAKRAHFMNRLGSLEKKSVPLGLHSDFNMAPVDPLYLAWIAANRLTLGNRQRGAAERISLDKALRAITIEAAQVIGMDDMVGSLAAGKKADLVALDRDPYRVGAAGLREIKIEGLVFEGTVA
jgi:predicted amidohydrolase YtcJ